MKWFTHLPEWPSILDITLLFYTLRHKSHRLPIDIDFIIAIVVYDAGGNTHTVDGSAVISDKTRVDCSLRRLVPLRFKPTVEPWHRITDSICAVVVIVIP